MNTLVSEIDLTRRIKKEKNHAKIIPRLIFIKFLYGEKSVIQASKDVSVAKRVGYQRPERWNESGYDGLIPRYAEGKLPGLTDDQKRELKTLL